MNMKVTFAWISLFLFSCGQSHRPVYVPESETGKKETSPSTLVPQASKEEKDLESNADSKQKNQTEQTQQVAHTKKTKNKAPNKEESINREVVKKEIKEEPKTPPLEIASEEEFFCTENRERSKCINCETLSLRVKRYGGVMKCSLMTEIAPAVVTGKEGEASAPRIKLLGTRPCKVFYTPDTNHYRIETEDKDELSLQLSGKPVPTHMTYDAVAMIRYDSTSTSAGEIQVSHEVKKEFLNCSKLTKEIVDLPNWKLFDD